MDVRKGTYRYGQPTHWPPEGLRPSAALLPSRWPGSSACAFGTSASSRRALDWYLRVFIDRDGGVSIDDCVDLTRLLSPALDEADPIDQSYCLEVSSPGVERGTHPPRAF